MKFFRYCLTVLAALALVMPAGLLLGEDDGESTVMRGGRGMMGGGMMGMMGEGTTEPESGHGRGGGERYCPYCGRSMGGGIMGRGMMGGGIMGRGMGSGMMGRGTMGRGMMSGEMMRPGMMCRGWGYPYQERTRPVDEDAARKMVERYIKLTGNPRLKIGEITAQETSFLVEIVTKDDSLVDKVLIEKSTGWMRPTD